jgi:hypothetical protein
MLEYLQLAEIMGKLVVHRFFFLPKFTSMQTKPPLGIRVPMLVFVLLFSMTMINAQQSPPGIDWRKDTVAADAAKKAQAKFRSDLNTSGRKATTKITMEVAKLKEVMDALTAKGITNVTFMIVTIRREDTAQYAKRNPGMTNAARNDLIGRQQLIIRVPRSAFTIEMGFRNSSATSTLMASLLLMGLSPLENNYAGLPDTDEDVYLGFGTICPPPASCTD